jgi:hypothetical protein
MQSRKKVQKELNLRRSWKEGVVTSDHRRTSFQEKRRTIGILCREFASSHELLDLTEKQGSYDESVERF